MEFDATSDSGWWLILYLWLGRTQNSNCDQCRTVCIMSLCGKQCSSAELVLCVQNYAITCITSQENGFCQNDASTCFLQGKIKVFHLNLKQKGISDYFQYLLVQLWTQVLLHRLYVEAVYSWFFITFNDIILVFSSGKQHVAIRFLFLVQEDEPIVING